MEPFHSFRSSSLGEGFWNLKKSMLLLLWLLLRKSYVCSGFLCVFCCCCIKAQRRIEIPWKRADPPTASHTQMDRTFWIDAKRHIVCVCVLLIMFHCMLLMLSSFSAVNYSSGRKRKKIQSTIYPMLCTHYSDIACLFTFSFTRFVLFFFCLFFLCLSFAFSDPCFRSDITWATRSFPWVLSAGRSYLGRWWISFPFIKITIKRIIWFYSSSFWIRRFKIVYIL